MVPIFYHFSFVMMLIIFQIYRSCAHHQASILVKPVTTMHPFTVATKNNRIHHHHRIFFPFCSFRSCWVPSLIRRRASFNIAISSLGFHNNKSSSNLYFSSNTTGHASTALLSSLCHIYLLNQFNKDWLYWSIASIQIDYSFFQYWQYMFLMKKHTSNQLERLLCHHPTSSLHLSLSITAISTVNHHVSVT